MQRELENTIQQSERIQAPQWPRYASNLDFLLFVVGSVGNVFISETASKGPRVKQSHWISRAPRQPEAGLYSPVPQRTWNTYSNRPEVVFKSRSVAEEAPPLTRWQHCQGMMGEQDHRLSYPTFLLLAQEKV